MDQPLDQLAARLDDALDRGAVTEDEARAVLLAAVDAALDDLLGE